MVFSISYCLDLLFALTYTKGPSINYVVSRGEGGQKLPILLSKKTAKRGGGGQKLPILRRHSLWTAPKVKSLYTYVLNNESNVHRWRFTTWSTVQLFRAVRTCVLFMTVTGIWTGFYPISKNSSIYSWFLKPLSVLHSRFTTKKLWVVAYFSPK